MTSATSRRPSARLVLLAALAGAAGASQPLRAVEAAPPAAGESAAPPSSAAAPPSPAGATTKPSGRGLPIADHAWPTEIGPEPGEADWAGATLLESGGPHKALSEGFQPLEGTVCAQHALGAWLRITCSPPTRHVGALWGLAGDVAKVKATFELVSERDHPTKPPADVSEGFVRKMGVSTTITLPVTPGSATLLGLDAIAWDDGYDSSLVVTSPGFHIHVSWALGEKSPTIFYR